MSETKMTALRFQELAGDRSNCILVGFHAIKHAIRFGAEILMTTCLDKAEIFKLARELAPDIETELKGLVSEWPRDEWQKLGFDVPTAIVSVAIKRTYALTDILKQEKPVVYLEEPRNLGNVGAVIRVAAAADSGGVIISGTIDPWAPFVIRGAAGLQYAVPVVSLTERLETERPIIALDPEGKSLEEMVIPSNAILAFGTERGGLSQQLLSRANSRVAIPMREKVSSMNLATSVAVALYALKFNQRS